MPKHLTGLPSLKRRHVVSSPVGVFADLYREEPHAFLYESLEHGARGRYSFIGARPDTVFRAWGDKIAVTTAAGTTREQADPFNTLERLVRSQRAAPSRLPFSGGAVGYIGYDAVRFLEQIPDRHPAANDRPDIYMIFPSELIVFDHQANTVDIVQSRPAAKRTVLIETALAAPTRPQARTEVSIPVDYRADLDEDRFCTMVEQAKEYIHAGDIFQVVLSQRIAAEVEQDPFRVYQALRLTNPSPYMYFLKFDDLAVLGSSPETLVKLREGVAFSRPIAGTRPRGPTPQEDRALEAELLVDEKERAEHVMLVDLARNDLGRVCSYGSVRVHDHLQVERFSRVMHMVSNITGILAPGQNAFDLFAASFPAGTVSGAPKIRAMEIIDELEPCRRGIYAGAIGYFGFDGNMDLSIAIRTITMKNRHACIQAGAGIVADSIPQREYRETINKMSALRQALEMAS